MAKLKTKSEIAKELREVSGNIHKGLMYGEENIKRDNLVAALVLIQKAKDILKNK